MNDSGKITNLYNHRLKKKIKTSWAEQTQT